MLKTYPIVRLRLNNQNIEFSEKDIIKAETIQILHPLSIEVPVSTANIVIHTVDPRFSMFSDGEFYNALVSNTIIDVYEYLDGEKVYQGRYYLDKWKQPSAGKFEFQCHDAIGVYDQMPYDGSFWANWVTFGELIRSILDPAGIPYTISPVIEGRQLKGWLKPQTIRTAIQQVCFAANVQVSTGKSETVNFIDAVLPIRGVAYPAMFYDQDEAIYDTFYYNEISVGVPITDVDKSQKQELEILQMVTGIELISHDYTQGTTPEEIYSAYLEPGEYKIVFQKPYYNISVVGVGDVPAYIMSEDGKALTTEDSRVLSFTGEFNFGSNFVFLHVRQAGNIVITGYPWIDSTQSFKYSEEEAQRVLEEGFFYDADNAIYDVIRYARTWVETAAINIWQIQDATLVPAQNAPLLLEKLVEYAKLRYRQKMTLWSRNDVAPADLKIVDSLYQKDIVGIVERVSADLTGGYLLETEVVGLERQVI